MVLVAVPQLALSWARLGRHWQLQEEAEKWWRGEQEEGDSRHSHLPGVAKQLANFGSI